MLFTGPERQLPLGQLAMFIPFVCNVRHYAKCCSPTDRQTRRLAIESHHENSLEIAVPRACVTSKPANPNHWKDEFIYTGNIAQSRNCRQPFGAGQLEIEMDDDGAFQDEQKPLTGKLQ
jgi:hypothetical protein